MACSIYTQSSIYLYFFLSLKLHILLTFNLCNVCSYCHSRSEPLLMMIKARKKNYMPSLIINLYLCRLLLRRLALLGETQEREKVLFQFACRYKECNPRFLDGNIGNILTVVIFDYFTIKFENRLIKTDGIIFSFKIYQDFGSSIFYFISRSITLLSLSKKLRKTHNESLYNVNSIFNFKFNNSKLTKLCKNA